MIGTFLKKIIGDKNAKDQIAYQPFIDSVKSVYPEIESLSDNELRTQTRGFIDKIQEEKSDLENQLKKLKEKAENSEISIQDKSLNEDEQLDEKKKAKKKEKKDPPLNKPKRGGSKAYYVYVRDPKTKKIKKVSFGSGGLRAKIKNKEARNAFAARHNCKNKKDRTKAGYWSCNLPRYAPALGLGAKMNTFW